MPERSFVWPEGHWDWLQHLAHKHGVRCGELIFVGGQVDKDDKGLRLNPYDLAAQTATVVRHIETVLKGFGADLTDVVKLVAFYVNDASVDERAFLADLGRHLVARGGAPDGMGPAITAVPLPWLAYPEMLVEIEAVAMLGADGTRLARRCANPAALCPLPAPFSHGLRCGEHLWLSGQSPLARDGTVRAPGDLLAQTRIVMDNLGTVAAELGADLQDAIKFNIWFEGDGTRATWQEAALAARRLFHQARAGGDGAGKPRPAGRRDDAGRAVGNARGGRQPNPTRVCRSRRALGLAGADALLARPQVPRRRGGGRTGPAGPKRRGPRAGGPARPDPNHHGIYARCAGRVRPHPR